MKIKCNACDGSGKCDHRQELKDVKTGNIWMTTKMCLKCYGEGELDWVENVVGKKIVVPFDLQLRIQSHPSTKWGPDIKCDGDNYEIKRR